MELIVIFEMILSKDSENRKLAEGIIESMIVNNDFAELTQLHEILIQYPNYAGFEVVVDKERIEEKIEEYLKQKTVNFF